MNIKIGILGLPNVGKSTLFNALTKTQKALSNNYPFCTIEPNTALAILEDKRLDNLAKIVNPRRIVHAYIKFVDIAGLIKGASKGDGLGNKFLSNIRDVQVLLHTVRCFEDKNIAHVSGKLDPVEDVKTIEDELILSDIEQLEKRIQKLKKERFLKDANRLLEVSNELLEHLNSANLVRTFKNRDNKFFWQINNDLRFLSDKNVIYVANVNENDLKEDTPMFLKLQEYLKKRGDSALKISAHLENELNSLKEDDAKMFLEGFEVDSFGLDMVVKKSFDMLNLINYFTAGKKEVRAWTIKKGTLAPKAGAVIHNDFQRGFIKAEVVSYEDYIKYSGEAKAKENGRLRIEGKSYIVQDGDIINFKFNV